MQRLLITASALALLAASGCAADEGPQPGPLQLGVASVKMPAPLGIGTAGYAGFSLSGHPSPFAVLFPATERLHGQPQFRAAVISRGPGFEAVFLRADMIGVFQQLRRAVVLELKERLGRDLDDELIFGATHTHSGPGRLINGSAIFALIADNFFPEFYERMVDAAADAVEQAYKDLRPGELGYLVAKSSEGQSDRRCEDGQDHVNGAIPTLLLKRDGQIDALVFSFAVHGSALGLDDLNLSRDVPGAVEQAVEAGFDHPVTAIFLNGWAADISPGNTPSITERSGATQPNGYDRMEKVGLAVAAALKKKLSAATWQREPEIGLRAHRFKISRELMGYAKGEFPYPYGAVYCGQSIATDCDTKTTISKLDTACIPFNVNYPVPGQTLFSAGQVGGLKVVTFPGECGTRLGEAISADVSKALGGGEVMFVGYAQDYTGYSLQEPDWWQGGYEAGGSLWGPRQGDYLRAEIARRAAVEGDPEGEQPTQPLAPFEAGSYSAYKPSAAKGLGAVLEQVKASYTPADVVSFSVAGADPWLGAPVATLQTAAGKAVGWPAGTPVTSDSYAFFVDLTPTPSYKDARTASSRQFAWRFSLPVRHKVDFGLPELSGSYRLSVRIPTDAKGGAKVVTSAAFSVSP